MPGGHPTAYRQEFAEQAAKLTKLGATDLELADFFGVDVRTIYNWKNAQSEFFQALKRGKKIADDLVEQSLFRRATGYSHEAVKILTVSLGNNGGSEVQEVPYTEHYPPDTAAAIFWLKNRRPDEWREKIEHTGANGGPIVVSWQPPPAA